MKSLAMKSSLTTAIFLFIFLQACTTAGPGLFNKKSPHEQYGDRLKNAGLSQTALGRLWFQEADSSLSRPLQVGLPYRETGYFAAERPRAMALQFHAKRGEKLSVK